MPCFAVLRRIIGPIGGKWIPYTAAQVTARRAAQMVLVMTCTSTTPDLGRPPVPSLVQVPPGSTMESPPLKRCLCLEPKAMPPAVLTLSPIALETTRPMMPESLSISLALPAPVNTPEPGSLSVLGLAVLVLSGLRRFSFHNACSATTKSPCRSRG